MEQQAQFSQMPRIAPRICSPAETPIFESAMADSAMADRDHVLIWPIVLAVAWSAALVYDELEGACRNLARKCASKGLWTPGKIKLDTDPWANVVTQLEKGLDKSNPIARRLTPSLMARIVGVTAHRNDSGHKPKNLTQRMKRDQELKTRFEGGIDPLRELLVAAKGIGTI